MNQIRLQEITFIYFTKTDGLPPNTVDDLIIHNLPDPSWWRELIEDNMEDVRLVLYIPPKPNTGWSVVHFLHWNDGTDLEQLDRRVMEGTHTPQDFENAILADPTGLICLNNYDWAADALEPVRCYDTPHMMPLFEPRLAQRRAKGQIVIQCPKCREPINIWLVKILRVRENPQPPPWIKK